MYILFPIVANATESATCQPRFCRRGINAVIVSAGLLIAQSASHADAPIGGCLRSNASSDDPGAVYLATQAEQDRVTAVIERFNHELQLDLRPIVDFREVGSFGATPDCRDTTKVGTVIVGGPQLLGLQRSALHAMDVVVMHELAHLLQFRADKKLRVAVCGDVYGNIKTIELIADFAAGYAMARLERKTDSTPLIIAVSKLADYDFSAIAHHGTVSERINAYNFGQYVAMKNRALDMARLLANSDEFMSVLSGPSQAEIRAAESPDALWNSAMERIYK